MTACCPIPGSEIMSLYAFETALAAEWILPEQSEALRLCHFADIATHMSAKNEALVSNGMEMKPFPCVRSLESIEALARSRGANIDLAAAEASSVLGQIR